MHKYKVFTVPAHYVFSKYYVMTGIQKEAKVTVFIFQDDFDHVKEPSWIF